MREKNLIRCETDVKEYFVRHINIITVNSIYCASKKKGKDIE